MSQQDRASDIVINHQTIKQVVDWLLVPALFAGMQTRAGAKWKPRMLAAAALLWACSDSVNLKDRFAVARKIVARVFRWQLPPGQTYQGFMKMLGKWHLDLMLVIQPYLRVQMREVLPGQWKIAGYVVFAGDGSRVELARTKSLEKAYSATKKRKKKTARKKNGQKRRPANHHVKNKTQSVESIEKKANTPQMWLTLLWHVGTGLPWAWKTGPSDSSERAHLTEMLAELPENSLITADAGFIGYDFWKSILDGDHHFLARVGGNVSLLKKLGCVRQHEHTVYLWPDSAAKKEQRPLVLRLIVVHDGKHPVYLVTDLNKSQLSDRQAATIYAKRWGIELFFRTVKQTFGRRKLRSRSAENAKLELDWSLLGVWCICLLGQRELVANGTDTARLSPAAAINAFQATLRDWRVRPETATESLWKLLRIAIQDDYTRSSSKTSRNYPRKKQRKRITRPKITNATKKQINAAKQLMQNEDGFRLTA
jgi:IS4 transposase